MENLKKRFSFGYDLENIELVELYLKNYVPINDYKVIVEIGDNCMNCLLINKNSIDEMLWALIERCDGQGNFTEQLNK